MKRLNLTICVTFVLYTLLTLPHFLYMITYDANIYINEFGKVVTEISAIGFPYPRKMFIIIPPITIILSKKIVDKII